jgi:putative transposase
MKETCNVVPLRHCDEIDDQLVNVLRSGARRLFAQAIESEAQAFLPAMKDLKLADGRDRVARHGHGPTRAIQTGIGPVEIERVKIRDRGAARDDERIRFTSAILPRWHGARRVWTRFCRFSTCGAFSTDFREALAALVGTDAPNLSPAVICRLTAERQGEYERWQKRDLSVLVGAKSRGLKIAPEIAVDDGALGFWKALDEIFRATRLSDAGCTKSQYLEQSRTVGTDHMKKDLREVYLAPNRASADVAIRCLRREMRSEGRQGG